MFRSCVGQRGNEMHTSLAAKAIGVSKSTILRAMLLPLIPLADWFRTILRVLIILLVTIVALYAIVVLYVRNLLRGNLEGRFKRVGGLPTQCFRRAASTGRPQPCSLATCPAIGSAPISRGDHGCDGGNSSRGLGARRRGRW